MRVRTALFSTLVVAVALAAGAAALVVLQRHSMIASVDRTAQARAEDLAALARAGTLPTTVAAGKEQGAFSQVVDASGQVVATSENIEGESPVLPADATDGPPPIRTVDVDALDGSFRVSARTTASPAGSVLVVAGESLRPVEDATRDLATFLVIGLPLLLIVVAGTAWVVTGRALRPVERIRAEVAAISEQELHRRVPQPASDDEIRRLADTMNAMLARLEDAYLRQERFVSDASHELQSPIASLRARLEVDLAHPDQADALATEREALEEVTALQRLVEDLLAVARLSSHAPTVRPEPVDLDDLLLREAERIRARGRVRVDVREVSAGQIEGSAPQLRRAIRNLLDNAERHATSEITLSLQERDAAVEIVVADDGPGIPPEDRARVFERFVRLDDARTPGSAGTGLGLAIAQEIVRAHGGTLSIEDNQLGARFIMRFPVHDGRDRSPVESETS